MEEESLGAGRADIFPAALACVKSVFDLTSFEQLTVSGYGVREGFMFNHAVPTTIEKPISDILGYSAYTTMYFSDVNIRHSEQVCMLSIQLFKQLRVLQQTSAFLYESIAYRRAFARCRRAHQILQQI